MGSLIPGFHPQTYFFFSLGAYLGIAKLNFVEKLKTHSVLVSTLTIILYIYLEFIGLFTVSLYPVFRIAGAASIFLVAFCLYLKTQYQFPAFIQNSSFVIYSSFYFIGLPLANKVVGIVVSDTSYYSLSLKYILDGVVATVIGIGIYNTARLLPNWMQIVISGHKNIS